MDARAFGVMLCLCTLWGLQQVSLKAVSTQASPMLMIAWRSLLALALLGAVMRWQGHRLQRANWPAGALVGLLFGLEFLWVAQALQRTQAAHVVVFLYTSPLFTALGLHLLKPAERLRPRAWLGLGLAFAGLVLAFLGGARGAAGAQQALLGDGLALLAGLAMGATTVAIRCSRLSAAPATETLCYQLMGAVVLLLPAAALTGQSQWAATPTVWAHLAFQGVVVSFASFLAWFWLLRRYLASRLGAFSFLTPLFGVVLGALLLDEKLTPNFLAGSALVLLGVAAANWPAAQPGSRSRA
ncbi:DMT family transporter [Roseateles puraquae]|uniref:EamA family transporter n=1 Tax=Roseateles puraquae TaxID=431059 RepID=A0A254N729_9BURK|nr:DMT family transporter [Roseateles puraquae]MDG0854318.1 DMT family transporter [Roseateles puraquae]OWR03811.1 EamA family transporter [Roseateles puraquae]